MQSTQSISTRGRETGTCFSHSVLRGFRQIITLEPVYRSGGTPGTPQRVHDWVDAEVGAPSMAFGPMKSLVISGASSLLRISGARRVTSSTCCNFSTYVVGSSGGRRSSIGCLGKQWNFQGLGFRSYAAHKMINVGDNKVGFPAQRRSRRGGVAASKGGATAAVKEDQQLEDEEFKSRNQSKRDSKRAKQWGVELAGLAPAQLKQAVRWAGLSQEVYDSVMIVKNLGTKSSVRNGRRRQYNYIGGLLRDVDPDVMEPVLKAAKDGDVESIIVNSPALPDPEDLDDKESWAEEEEEEEEEDEDSPKFVAEEWLHGLINGILSVEEEVYSIYDVEYDRQELRRLLVKVRKSNVSEPSATSDPTVVDEVDPSATLSAKGTKSIENLRHFLINIAKQRAENQTL